MAASKSTKSTSKVTQTQWIAERRLERRDAVEGLVIVRIGSPEWPSGAEEWRCPFIIEGLGDDSVHFGRSIDSMAALQNALIGIRQILERSGTPLRWEGFDEDFAGFPRDVPWELGLAFYRRMENMIDAKIEEHHEVQRKARKGPRIK